MPIVIQELIASDTISQAVDKINFNFDQLILNGGGPSGPAGPPGPIGPIGGRGVRGSKWYEDSTSSPGTDPNGLIFTDLVEGDNYLQANGAVWDWNGTAWTLSPVNLTGPQGIPGVSAGFSYFGSNVPALPRYKQVIYPAPFGPGDGANVSNEGISAAVFGAAISNDTLYPGSIGTSKITDTLAASIDSSIVSTLVHVKSTAAKSIMFSGGDTTSYYEQNSIGNLSNITLLADDALGINVPKAPANPSGDLIGFRLNTFTRGQQFRAGKNITFITGVDATTYPSATPDISDFVVNVNGYSSLSSGPKISLNVLYSPASASIDLGGIGTLPITTTKLGSIALQGQNISVISSSQTRIISGGTTGSYIDIGGGIQAVSSSDVNIQATSGSDIFLTSNSGGVEIYANGGSSDIDVNAGRDIRIVAGNIINLYRTGSTATGIQISPVSSPTGATEAIRLKGNVTWKNSGYANPYTGAFKHVHIDGSSLTATTSDTLPVAPLIVKSNLLSGSGTGQIGGDAISIQPGGGGAFATSARTTLRAQGITVHAGQGSAVSYDNDREGISVRGKDGYNISSANDKKNFHARRNATEIANRAVFTTKTLTYTPLTPSGFDTINLTTADIDTTFLDIQIGHGVTGTVGSPGAWSNLVTINIPDGIYHGQRLFIRVIAAPSSLTVGTTTYRWPQNTGSSASGYISLRAKTSGLINNTLGTTTTGNETFETAHVIGYNWTGIPGSAAGSAGEMYAELLWLGKIESAVDGSTTFGVMNQFDRGWNVCCSYGISRRRTGFTQYSTGVPSSPAGPIGG